MQLEVQLSNNQEVMTEEFIMQRLAVIDKALESLKRKDLKVDFTGMYNQLYSLENNNRYPQEHDEKTTMKDMVVQKFSNSEEFLKFEQKFTDFIEAASNIYMNEERVIQIDKEKINVFKASIGVLISILGLAIPTVTGFFDLSIFVKVIISLFGIYQALKHFRSSSIFINLVDVILFHLTNFNWGINTFRKIFLKKYNASEILELANLSFRKKEEDIIFFSNEYEKQVAESPSSFQILREFREATGKIINNGSGQHIYDSDEKEKDVLSNAIQTMVDLLILNNLSNKFSVEFEFLKQTMELKKERAILEENLRQIKKNNLESGYKLQSLFNKI